MRFFLVVLVLAGLSAPARAGFIVGESEKLDAATFLNAISDDPRFVKQYPGLAEEWQPRLRKDPVAWKAFERWRGRGIQLAYLLSALPENDLGPTLRRFDDPASAVRDIEAGLDEPAYAPVFADLKAHPGDVRTLLTFLRDNGFLEMRRSRFADQLAATRRTLEANLDQIDAESFAGLLEAFTVRPDPDRPARAPVSRHLDRPDSF